MSTVRSRWPRALPVVPLVVAGVLGGTIGLRGLSAAVSVQANQRTVTIGVLDRAGVPVAGLTIDDVIVREDGLAREVVRVSPAAPPTEVVLLVDDSQAAVATLRDVREALNGFAYAMADLTPVPAMRLATFGDRPTVLVDFNPTFSAISRGIERIAPRPGAGATLLEAISESATALQRRRALRPVIVAFVAEAGPEFGELRHTTIASDLRRVNASLWTVVLSDGPGGGSSSPERERDVVIGDVTRQSGGRTTTILTPQSLPETFARVARQLTERWEVTYGRPDTLVPPASVDVRTVDATLEVLSPRWTSR